MIIALSGKCCSGKNFVTNRLEKHGLYSIDVDLLSKDAFNSSTDKIIDLFGSAILTDNKVDRKKVGEIVFSNGKKRKELEDIIHPLVYDSIFKTLDDHKDRSYVINIPLLNDKELIDRCDAIVWIKSPLFLRIFRALRRDPYHFFTVIHRIFAQRSLSAKYFSANVDTYYVENGLFSSFLEKDLNKVLYRIQRG